MVSLTEDEFELIYDALKRANNPYTNDEVAALVAAEAKAWAVVQRIRDMADQPA